MEKKEGLEQYTREDLTKMIKSHNLQMELLKKEVHQLTEVYQKKCARELVEKSVGKALRRIPPHIRELARDEA